jgi:hypothetical protein
LLDLHDKDITEVMVEVAAAAIMLRPAEEAGLALKDKMLQAINNQVMVVLVLLQQ